MADIRCANPEYQLDVDTMMLEYTLYHAIHAKLNRLKTQLSDERPAEKDVDNDIDRLVVSFDILIKLFKYHHPTVPFGASTTFNIKILEFAILLVQQIRHEPCSTHLLQERKCNNDYRRQWLRSWIASGNAAQHRMSNTNALIAKIDPDLPPIEETSDTVTVNLTDLLVRFLDLSAEISESMGFVNETWYRLAAEFMLQCAIERVQSFPKLANGTTTQTGLINETNSRHLATAVAECFAWGSIDFQPSTKYPPGRQDRWLIRYLEEQIFISKMFTSQRIHTDTDGEAREEDESGNVQMYDGDDNIQHKKHRVATEEDPTWTRLRTKYLANALDLVDASNERGDRHALARQKRRRPLNAFLRELRTFIDGLWCLNMREDMSGKPVLVQIEEGGLTGMGEDQFSQFLDQVGLKRGHHRDESGRSTIQWLR